MNSNIKGFILSVGIGLNQLLPSYVYIYIRDKRTKSLVVPKPFNRVIDKLKPNAFSLQSNNYGKRANKKG